MNQDETTLADILDDIWRAKLAIMFFALLGLGLAIAWIALATPYYKASMIVSPANPMNGSEISPSTAGDDLFALRYLVQRMGVSNSSDFQHFENIVDGTSVASELMKDPEIVAGLKKDTPFSFIAPQTRWSPEEVADYLTKHVKIEPVSNTALRKLVYSHPNREFSVYLLDKVHKISDSIIREHINTEASERIVYLNRAIEATTNPEHRRALTTLLLEQERLKMLVSIDRPYAATVLEPPSAGTRVDWPDGVFLISVFLLVGAFIGFVIHGVGRR